MKRNAPTLSDVAHEAGVSAVAVSVVLNNSKSKVRVSEATRERILKAAANLRYHPNAMARGLARQRTNTLGIQLGVIDPTVAIANPFASALLQGVMEGVAAAGYDLHLFVEPWEDAERSGPKFRSRGTDGVLVVAPLLTSDITTGLVGLGIPVVTLACCTDSSPAPGVSVDNTVGARLATEHLLSLGHTRIAHLMGDDNQESTHLRRDGFLDTLTAAGVSVPREYLVPGSYSGKNGGEALRYLLSLPKPPSAIFAASDGLAIAVLREAALMGVVVPDQLSLVGFNDTAPAAMVTPALTTIHEPLAEIGQIGVRLLVAIIEGRPPEAPSAQLLKPHLVVRASTAAVQPPPPP